MRFGRGGPRPSKASTLGASRCLSSSSLSACVQNFGRHCTLPCLVVRRSSARPPPRVEPEQELPLSCSTWPAPLLNQLFLQNPQAAGQGGAQPGCDAGRGVPGGVAGGARHWRAGGQAVLGRCWWAGDPDPMGWALCLRPGCMPGAACPAVAARPHCAAAAAAAAAAAHTAAAAHSLPCACRWCLGTAS